MNNSIDHISPVKLGERLRNARDSARITQADAADSINVARTTLIAVEQGKRKIRLQELRQLANLYHTNINSLLRLEAVYIDLAPRFRKLAGASDSAAESAVEILTALVRAEVELESLLGVQRRRNDPPERAILPGDVRAQAEQDALEFRQWMGLGNGPIPDIVSLLELELGARVYVRKLDSRVSSLFAYDDVVGICILLNANHPRERRNQSAGHECGHLITTRRSPEILLALDESYSREERYASAFGRAFLMPARAVKQKFSDTLAGAEKLTRRHVIVLSHFFGVSREAMVRRLEELRLTKTGTWDWFQQYGGITDEQYRQVVGDLIVPDQHEADVNRPTSLRLGLLATEAYRNELLTEGQLGRLLQLDRVELRQLLDEVEQESGLSYGVEDAPN